MDIKQSIAKIINLNRIIQRIKCIPKLLPVGFISILSLIPLSNVSNRSITVYAQQQDRFSDPWNESINIARSKVEAALSPGAFGHGVPELNTISSSDVLFAFGVTLIIAFLVFVGTKLLFGPLRNMTIYQWCLNFITISAVNKNEPILFSFFPLL